MVNWIIYIISHIFLDILTHFYQDHKSNHHHYGVHINLYMYSLPYLMAITNPVSRSINDMRQHTMYKSYTLELTKYSQLPTSA